MDALRPVSTSTTPRTVAPREAEPAAPPPGPSEGTAAAPPPLPRPAADGPAAPSFDAPPPPLSVQREQLRPPEPPLMTTEQMRTLLDAVVTGTGQRIA